MISGYVDDGFTTGETGDGEFACSFFLISDNSVHSVKSRVNSYGALAEECERQVYTGTYCVITGELMNRRGKFGRITEIRARKIEFFNEDKVTSD
jgi:hypothetical protein